MKRNSNYKQLFCVVFLCAIWGVSCKNLPGGQQQLDFSTRIPAAGNSWAVNSMNVDRALVKKTGIHDWSDLDHIIRIYFKLSHAGKLDVGLNLKALDGSSTIRVSLAGQTKETTFDNKDYKDVGVGTFEIAEAGYHYVEIQGVKKSGAKIGDIQELLIGNIAAEGKVYFVPDDFYFGRRGPSVHLTYKMPEAVDAEWFYSEITVPEGEDVLGSYFMANGFGEGYFGMQVNSESERRVLFSVWSPYKTDDPSSIPDDYKIILLGKGEGVTSGEFGNEGSGGQSYKRFAWKAGTTYKFLLKGVPSENNSTDYTAYFYAPEIGDWQLMASFRRPHTSTYLTRFHSFLENFIPSAGHLSRKAYFDNQWICDTKGTWHELTQARFTADATARKESRMDYGGGVDGKHFYMKNCGFFSETTAIGEHFSRPSQGEMPEVVFSNLAIPRLP